MSMTEAYIDPSRENFDHFKALPRDTPIHMLNLVRFREHAAYPEGHELAGKGLTGADAYREYMRTIQPVLERAGGHIVWAGGFEAMVTGPAEWEWDETFVMAYPDAASFMGMVKDPDYAPVVVHRQAAVATSRLVRFGPRESLNP
jgi:uncharacterized protein (DUF1330 family)